MQDPPPPSAFGSEQYGRLFDSVLYRRELHPGARMLYAALDRHRPQDGGPVYPSVRSLAERLGVSARAISAWLNELERAGLIAREPGRTGVSNRYRLLAGGRPEGEDTVANIATLRGLRVVENATPYDQAGVQGVANPATDVANIATVEPVPAEQVWQIMPPNQTNRHDSLNPSVVDVPTYPVPTVETTPDVIGAPTGHVPPPAVPKDAARPSATGAARSDGAHDDVTPARPRAKRATTIEVKLPAESSAAPRRKQPTSDGWKLMAWWCQRTKTVIEGDARRREALLADELLTKAGIAARERPGGALREAQDFIAHRLDKGWGATLRACAASYQGCWRDGPRQGAGPLSGGSPPSGPAPDLTPAVRAALDRVRAQSQARRAAIEREASDVD